MNITKVLILMIVPICVVLTGLSMANASVDPAVNMHKYQSGENIFMTYCAKCHGKKANGRGRMAPLYRRMNARQPSNFTVKFYQYRPEGYLKNVILQGGEANSLSKYMPPFAGELEGEKLDDVVYFIKNVSKFYYK